MQAVPDSTQSDAVSAVADKKKKKATKKKKRKAESKDSKNAKKKKSSKGKSKGSIESGDKGACKSTSPVDRELDLNVEMKPIGEYIKDREEMIDQMFSCVLPDKLTAMLPNILKEIPVEEVKALCLTELEGMSKKRIRYILAGQEMLSSSGTEESESETEAAQADPVEDIDSPSNQMADSTSNLQASDNQSDPSVENLSELSGEPGSGEAEYEEEMVYQESEEEYEEEEASYHGDEEQMGEEYDEEQEREEQEYEEQEEGSENDQNYEAEEQYVEEEEMEYVHVKEEQEQEQYEEQAPDADDRTSHSNEDEMVEMVEGNDPKEQDDTQMDEEEPTIEDVPKRMRKDVDDADVEEGEVFDDDEDEKIARPQGEDTTQKDSQNSTTETTTTQDTPAEQVETNADGTDEQKPAGATQIHLPTQDDQTKKDNEEQSKEETMEQDQPVSHGQNSDRLELTNVEELQGHGTGGGVDKVISDQIQDMNTHKPAPSDQTSHTDNRTHSSIDQIQGANDKIPDSSSSQVSHHKTQHASSKTQSQPELTQDSSNKTILSHSQTQVSSDKIAEGQLDKVSGLDNVSNTREFIDKFNVSPSDTNKGTRKEQGSSNALSGIDKDESCNAPDTTKGADCGSRDGTEISSVSKTGGAIITHKSETDVENGSKPCDESIQTVEKEQTGNAENAEVDNADSVNDNADESGSDSDSSSTGSDETEDTEEDEDKETQQQQSGLAQGAEGGALPVSDELEMLELELRARAIRSLMKKMGKE